MIKIIKEKPYSFPLYRNNLLKAINDYAITKNISIIKVEE
jgi:hypothetical protein